jgi:hypothetical protein
MVPASDTEMMDGTKNYKRNTLEWLKEMNLEKIQDVSLE